MQLEEGVFKITNPEGAFCQVNTVDPEGGFYGPGWRTVCESLENGGCIDAVVDRVQYRSENGEPDTNRPRGFVVTLGESVEAFLPGSHSFSLPDIDENIVGREITVRVKEFDPYSLNVIVIETSETLANIKKAYEEGETVLAEVVRHQYRNDDDGHGTRVLAGLIVKIGDHDAFLPWSSCCRRHERSEGLLGTVIVVMVDRLELKPLNIVVREIPTTGVAELNIELINQTLEVINEAYENGGTVAGTIVGEQLNRNCDRAGYRVGINGIEAFLPCSLAPFPLGVRLDDLLGKDINATVVTINRDRLGIVLSAQQPFLHNQYETRTTDSQQPLIVYTDASTVEENHFAAFSIVADNINTDFHLPQSVLGKYVLRSEPESCPGLGVFSGVVLNFEVDAIETVAIIAAVEVLSHLAVMSGQKILIYTDSLFSKRLLGSKRISPDHQKYSDFRKKYDRLLKDFELEVSIYKVQGHSGVELNELADTVAKRRRRSPV